MTGLFFDAVNGICTALAWFMYLTIIAGILYWGTIFAARFAYFLITGLPL